MYNTTGYPNALCEKYMAMFLVGLMQYFGDIGPPGPISLGILVSRTRIAVTVNIAVCMYSNGSAFNIMLLTYGVSASSQWSGKWYCQNT